MNTSRIKHINDTLLNALSSDSVCREATVGELLSGAASLFDGLMYAVEKVQDPADQQHNREVIDMTLRLFLKNHGLVTN
jgi:hypothetical protein